MIEMLIQPRDAVLTGDMHVRRVLPFRARRMVGPFAFLDEMGPLTTAPGTAGDVPPHPHIGLSTVTWLFEGALVHRDSLGNVQAIEPGELNWMTAGRGIVHSERVPSALRSRAGRLHGLQAWVALPLDAEEREPAFQHLGREELPSFEAGGCALRLIAGQAFGHSSPSLAFSRLFYVEARLPEGKTISFDPEGQEAAFYLVRGVAIVAGTVLQAPVLAVFGKGKRIELTARAPCLGMLLGGEALEGHRTIWWNFVSSSRDRIERAKQLWRDQAFPPVPGETEFIPLPGTQADLARSTLP